MTVIVMRPSAKPVSVRSSPSPGPRGKGILSGVGPPTDDVGVDGEHYLADGHVLYGPKTGGTWPAVGVDLTGPPGAVPAGVVMSVDDVPADADGDVALGAAKATALVAETSARTQADADEALARATGDQAAHAYVDQSVTAEAAARATAIAAEATLRIAAVTGEANTRAAAVTALAGQLADEVARAIAAEAGKLAKTGGTLTGPLVLSGDPTADPQAANRGWVLTQITAAIDSLVGLAPGVLDHIDEIAAALGNDPNFATTIMTALAGKVPNARQITAGAGLTGGGDLSADRSIAVHFGTTPGLVADGGALSDEIARALQAEGVNAAAIAAEVARAEGVEAAKANDVDALHKAGAETVTGSKDFTGGVTKNGVNVETTAGSQAKADAARDAAIGASQPLDADLSALAALDATQAGMPATDGAGWVRKTYTQVRAALGLGNSATRDVGTAAGTVAAGDDARFTLETVHAVAASGAALALSLADGTIHRITLTANCTITLPAAVLGASFTLVLVQDATAGRTVTWATPAGTALLWSGNVAPLLSNTNGKRDVVDFLCADGATWLGMPSINTF